MKNSRFTEVQVVQAFQKHESGDPRVIYAMKWVLPLRPFTRGNLSMGVEVSDVQKLKTLVEEHSRLERMYADLAMDNQAFRDLFSKKGWALPTSGK